MAIENSLYVRFLAEITETQFLGFLLDDSWPFLYLFLKVIRDGLTLILREEKETLKVKFFVLIPLNKNYFS